MASRYCLKIVTDFAASHSLRDYPGDCARLHGHNWGVEIEVSASRLDDLGMVIDFKEIKRMTHVIISRLDHYYLNEIPPFDTINPTAENISAYIYRELKKQIDTTDIEVEAVTLWETERASVRYSET